MSESTSSSWETPQSGPGTRTSTVICPIARTTRKPNLQCLVPEPRPGSPGKRQRTRKLSKPQKRFKQIDTHQNQETELKQSPPRKLNWPRTVCRDGEVVAVPKTAGRPCKPDKILGSCEDIKKETLHGFIVDQWYDLGPSYHKEGHSPVLPDSTEIEKLETKESPGSTSAEVRPQNDSPKDNSKCKNATIEKIHLILPSDAIRSTKDHQVAKSDHVEPATDKRQSSKPEDLDQVKNLNKLRDRENTSRDPPFSLPLSFLECPLANTANSFDCHADSNPLPLHTVAPYLQGTTTINLDSYERVCTSLSAPSPGICSYTTSLSLPKPDAAYTYVRLEAEGTQKNIDHARTSNNEQRDNARKLEHLVKTAPATSCTANVESVASFQSPVATTTLLTSSNCRFEGGLPYQGLLYPNSLYQRGAFHSAGVVLVPSHPYYVQQVPYVSMLSPVNYPQTDISNGYSDTGSHASGATNEEQGGKTRTPAPYVLKMIVPSSTEVSNARPADEQDTNRAVTSQQPSRVKIQPKLKDSTDFLDPTRIKFDADDVDTDDDSSRMNDDSDCSDKEWQPVQKNWKSGRGREIGSGECWTPKEDNHMESGSPVKKAYTRRRQGSTKEPAECNVCGKVFQGIYYLRRHQMSHSDIRPYQCDLCHKSFKQKAHLIGHQNVHDRALKLLSADAKNPCPKSKPFLIGSKCPGRPKKTYNEKDLACKECGKAFKTVYRLKRHELSHTDVRPFSCRICGKGFKQTGHRNEHEANHEKTKRRFLCNMCGVVFRSRSSFNNHMRSHGTQKLRLQNANNEVDGNCPENKQETGEVCQTGYDCPYCPEKFATAQALNSHLETHVEVQQRRHVQPYSCDVCRRAFTYRHNLIKHKLMHKAPDKFAHFYKEKVEAHVASGKPSFKCVKCAKVFIRKETLAKHSKIHSGNKPFKCAICSRDFTQNVHLKVHMRKHTGSRPFQCKECNRSFIDSTALAKHIEYEACNTDNWLYHCGICDKLHYYLGSIKQHIRKKHNIQEGEVVEHILRSERSVKRRTTAEGEKYPCKVCTSNFSEKCNLIRHIRRKHAGLVELLHKELEVKTAKNIADDDNNNDITDIVSSKFDEADNDKASNMDKDSSMDMKVCKDSNGSWAELSDSSECSGIKTPECDAFIDNNATSSSDTEGSRHQVAEGNLPPVIDEALESPDAVPSDMQATSVTNISQGLDFTSEISSSREHEHNHFLHSPEHDDRKLSLTCKEAEENGTDAFLEGFQRTDFVISDPEFIHCCVPESFLCKNDCCLANTGNRCIPSDMDCLPERELTSFVSKGSMEEDYSSPTNINFLYNIGLVVSSKAKVSRDCSIKDRSVNRDHDWNNDLLIPSCNSLARLDKSNDLLIPSCNSLLRLDKSNDLLKPSCNSLARLDKNNDLLKPSCNSLLRLDETASSQDTDTHFDDVQVVEHVCCRPENVNFLEDFLAKDNTITTVDGSSSIEFYIPCNMDFCCNSSGDACKENMTSCTSQCRDSNDSEKFDKKCHAKYDKKCYADAGIHGKAAEQNIENNFQRTFNNYTMKALTTSADNREPAEAGDGHNNLVDDDVCELKAAYRSVPSCKEEAASARLYTETRSCDDMQDNLSIYSQTEEQISRQENVTQAPGKEDSSVHTIMDGLCVYTGEISKSLPESHTGFSPEQDREDCQGEANLTANTSATPVASPSSPAKVGQSLISSLWMDYDSETRISNILPLISKHAHPFIPESSNLLPWRNSIATVATNSGEDLSHSDTSWQPGNESDPKFELVSNSSVLTVRAPVVVSSLPDLRVESDVTKLERTEDRKSGTPKHQSSQPDHVLKSDGCQRQLSDSRKNVTPQVSIADSTNSDYEACPTESHLKYLGLLACKDAVEIRNKNIPLEDLYETYKPWLEDLVHKTRPRRTKSSRSSLANKDTSTGNNSAAALLPHETLPSSSHCLEHKANLRKMAVRDSVESKTSRELDDAQQTLNESSILKRKISLIKERKKCEERKSNHGLLEEQLSQPLAASDPRDRQESRHYRVRTSTSDHQLLDNPTSSLASSTTHPQAEVSVSVSNTAVLTGPAAGACRTAASVSPPTTPDSTVRGRMLFSCLVCNKYFTARHQLKRHEMTHTDHRPYNCDKCGRAFRQKVHLSDHIKRHQGQRPFVCAGCGKRFVLKNEMNQHIKNHCKGTVDIMKGEPAVDDKSTLTVPVNEYNPPADLVTVPKFDSQEFMLMFGHSYKAGDIISNGTITLRVIESAESHTTDKRDSSESSVARTSSGEAESTTATSHYRDYSTPSIQCQDQPGGGLLQGRKHELDETWQKKLSS